MIKIIKILCMMLILRGDPNLQQLGKVDMGNISLVFYNYTD